MTIEGSARPRRQTLNVPMKIIAGGTGGTLLAVAVYLVVNGVIIGLIGVVLVGLLLLFVYSRMTMEIAERAVSPLREIRRSPFIDAPAVPFSVWDGIEVGTTYSGERLTVQLTDGSMIVAGRTRSGKTVFLNSLIAGCALDPNVQLSLVDGKGTMEFHRYRHVAKVDRSADPARMMAFLTELDRECERRYDVLGRMGAVKMTREIYESGEMKLHVVVIDELAAFTNTPRKKSIGAANTDLLGQIAAKGAGCGVLLILTNQRISADLVASKIRSNVDSRVAFRVWDRTENEMALGPGQARRGFDASEIPSGVTHRGVGYASFAGMETVKFRGDLLEYNDTLEIARKAAIVRGIDVSDELTLEEPLAADTDDADEDVLMSDYLEPGRDLLEDIKHVWGRDEARLHLSTILDRLKEFDPAFYAGWTQNRFGRRLRDVGLASFKRQMTIGDKVNHWGLEASALYAGDDGKNSKLERAEREQAALDALDDRERALYDARLAEIQNATACSYCGVLFTIDNPPTVDHLFALNAGGASYAWSLVPACKSCNSSRRDRDALEWYTAKFKS